MSSAAATSLPSSSSRRAGAANEAMEAVLVQGERVDVRQGDKVDVGQGDKVDVG